MKATTGDDCWGVDLHALLPGPVPARYRLLSPDERAWRGRGCMAFWLMGYPPGRHGSGLSTDPGWAAYLRDHLSRDLDDRGLDVRVLRRRLADAAGQQTAQGAPQRKAAALDRD